jgi:hypothetical protein
MDGGLQYWQQLGQQEAQKAEIRAAKYAAAYTACETILRDDVDDIETAKAQAKWAMDKIKKLEAA